MTNASTTGLLAAGTGTWDDELFARLGLPRALMPDIVQTGTQLGTLRTGLHRESGLDCIPIIAPATHDTGSAVVGTPLEPGGAYISSGTWSLVGVERTAPLLDEAAARANFTNEVGAFGTVRFLKNVMGLWILDARGAGHLELAPDELGAEDAAAGRIDAQHERLDVLVRRAPS